ncbi:MAG: hypothetical protein MUC83_12630, partial [Pirellula sp.]|nr:hypothetical protein [Pirellula sp.]
MKSTHRFESILFVALDDHLTVSNWQSHDRQTKMVGKMPLEIKQLLWMGCRIIHNKQSETNDPTQIIHP